MNSWRGDLRATLSAVEPSSPVENFSLTPRCPIITQVGAARPIANLVGDDAHVEHGLDREILAPRRGGKFVEHAAAAGGQHLAHLGREIQIWFQPERT